MLRKWRPPTRHLGKVQARRRWWPRLLRCQLGLRVQPPSAGHAARWHGAGCTGVGCVAPADLNDSCPSELQDKSVACMSACEVFGQPQYCCRAAYGTPDTCKTACPRAYDYKSSSFICASADYTITFCPNSKTR
ncbi:hypothetical protein SLA2020_271150 [Shorea laevis]